MMAEKNIKTSPISDVCYTLYKMRWMSQIPEKMQQDAYKNWYEEEYVPNLKTILNPHTGEADTVYEGLCFEDWMFEVNGYEGFGYYVSYEEFMTNEYQDAEYIKELLDNAKLYLNYLTEVAQ